MSEISLNLIAEKLKEAGLFIELKGSVSDIKIETTSFDSREALAGCLFICKGQAFKESFLDSAINNGAVAYISEVDYGKEIPAIIVSDIRKAMAISSMIVYNYPHNSLKTIGLTGTKGKTTTSYFIHNILNKHYNKKTGLLSSVAVCVGEREYEAHLTTPESPELQKLLAEMVAYDQKAVTMEVSSQAYLMNRVDGMTFDYGVFLNVGEDHIGPLEHVDFEDYLSCKLKFVENCKTMVINADTDYFDRIKAVADKHCENVITFGDKGSADYIISNVQKLQLGFEFELTYKGITEEYEITMPGRFNIENSVAAIIISKQIGASYEDIILGLKETKVMGRMNLFEGKDITIIVDYAHNYVSFKKLYESVKLDYPNRRVTVLFGCPGGKAHLRRRDIGMLSGEYADYIYITAEDPQYEEVLNICEDIANFVKPYNKPYEIIEDRETAVRKAIAEAKAGDVLLLTGKGEEFYQKVRGEYVYYASDFELAKECLEIRDSEVSHAFIK